MTKERRKPRKKGKKHQLEDQDFLDNPATRTPVCLVLDVSGSMEGEPIEELRRGVVVFLEEVSKDVIARISVEVAAVTFSDQAQIVIPFSDVEKVKMPTLNADGWTRMGAGVNLALDILEERKKIYKREGIAYHQPWMVLMTDGRPENEPEEITEAAAKRTTELVKNKKLVIFPLGIGHMADREALERFSPLWEPMKLQGLKFASFFRWLSASVIDKSKSLPEQEVPVNTEGMKDWAVRGWDTYPP